MQWLPTYMVDSSFDEYECIFYFWDLNDPDYYGTYTVDTYTLEVNGYDPVEGTLYV